MKSSAPNWFVTAFQVSCQMNERPNCADRRPGAVDDLVDDQADQRDRAEGGERRDPAQGEVAEAVAPPPRLEGVRGARSRTRLPRRGSIAAAVKPPGPFTASSPELHTISTLALNADGDTRSMHDGDPVGRGRARRRRGAARGPREVVFDIDDLAVHYGPTTAFSGVTLDIFKNQITAVIGPSGLRQEHVHPLPEPDERPRPRRQGRRQDPLPRPGHLRQRRRPDRGAPADRHGLPAAESVPEVDLRQRRVRAEGARHEGRHRTNGSRRRSAAPRSGTRSRTG